MSILDATTGVTYATLTAAITAVNAGSGGDVLQVPAGSYVENFPTLTQAMTIEGVGGFAQLTTPGQPLNGKAILVVDANVTLRGLDLSGATVGDGNGAGVRFETGNLVVQNCHIHGNQDGILTAGDPASTLTIDHSELDHNGTETGYTHNLYVGTIAQLTVTQSYFHDALGGHEIKSRAASTIITGSRIQDGPTADSSYSIDLPAGGVAMLANNTIEKGQHSQNDSLIHFGGELVPVFDPSSLTITGNIFINDLGPQASLLYNQSIDITGHAVLPQISGNTLYGLSDSQLIAGGSGAAYLAINSFQPIGSAPPLDTSPPAYSVPAPGAGPLLLALAVGVWARGRAARRRRQPAGRGRIGGLVSAGNGLS